MPECTGYVPVPVWSTEIHSGLTKKETKQIASTVLSLEISPESGGFVQWRKNKKEVPNRGTSKRTQ